MFEPLNYISEPEHASIPEIPRDKKPPQKAPFRFSRRQSALWCLALAALLSFAIVIAAPPKGFPEGAVISVEKGETLSGIARMLREDSIIRSEFVFKSFLTLFGGSKGLVAGDYYLERKESAIILAWRFSAGSYRLKNIKVTIPEGTSVAEIIELFKADRRFTHFNAKEFDVRASAHEGYLFPDTYLFLPNVEARQVVDAMRANYDRKIGSLEAEIQAFGRPIEDIIKMASIVEEEARTEESRRTIAGILWKRLDQGMPLQVDAAFAFVNGKKDSRYITLEDLQIDSPYNTYVKKGLPPTPISNPGLDAIAATIRPIKTKYYFYLSDNEGKMHYGVTHEDHLINKAKYISW